METRISYPVGVVGPGLLPSFMVGSMRPGQGGVTGYGAINVGPDGRARRVGPVLSPIGPVMGYRDRTRPLGPVTRIPSDLPGPIYPGYPGSWHVGPTVIREGRLRYGSYGAPGSMPAGLTSAATGVGLLVAVLGGAAFGAGAGALIGPSASQGAKIGAVASLLSMGLSLLLPKS